MKFIKLHKRMTVASVALAVALIGAGVAYAFWSSPGAGAGSVQTGTTSNVEINQLGTPLYNSTIGLDDYSYSQAFNGPQITQFGDEVTLASAPGALTSAIVGMTMCDGGCAGTNASVIPSYVTSVTFNVYAPGDLSTPLTSDTENITVPAVPVDTAAVTFNALFSNFSPSEVLPSTVVYGVTLNGLVADCASTPGDCGNDPDPVGSLNVNIVPEPTDVTVGSDTNAGTLFVRSAQADISGTALGSNLGACTGAPTSPLTTFQEIPVSCAAGYGNMTPPSPAPSSWVPAVELERKRLGRPVSRRPGSANQLQLDQHGDDPRDRQYGDRRLGRGHERSRESDPGNTATDIAGCYASWFQFLSIAPR